MRLTGASIEDSKRRRRWKAWEFSQGWDDPGISHLSQQPFQHAVLLILCLDSVMVQTLVLDESVKFQFDGEREKQRLEFKNEKEALKKPSVGW